MNLVNAEQLSDKFPDTFNIPTRSQRISIKTGNYCKIIILDKGIGERVWVKVLYKDKQYIGILMNKPLDLNCLSDGDYIEFGPEHIINIVNEVFDILF